MTSFIYDSANRLTQENVNGVQNTKYKWNATYGWRTSQGPTDAKQPITFTYTATGRLATYGDSTRSLTATYTYDAAGQRTKSVITVGATTTTTTFAYDGLTLMSLSATQGSTTWRIDYLYDEEGVPFGGVYRSPASSTSPTSFTMTTTDRGDAVQLCDAGGAAFAAYRYDAWGLPQGAGSYATGVWTQGTTLVNSTLAGQIASRQILRYAAYAWDSESALYYCSARYYDPQTRQWTTGDPAKADGEESAYQYCGGEPVGGVDCSGLYIEDANHRTPLRVRAAIRAYSLPGEHVSTFKKWWSCGDWCAIFVSFVYGKEGSWAFKQGERFARVTIDSGDNRGIWAAANKRQYGLRLVSSPKRGDLILYQFDDVWRYDHVGIVYRPRLQVTIEGNTKCPDAIHENYQAVEEKERSGVNWDGSGKPAFVRVTK